MHIEKYSYYDLRLEKQQLAVPSLYQAVRHVY